MSQTTLILLAVTGAAASAAGEDARPNIIVLLADDLRWDALGYAGNTIIQTPTLDELARTATRFRQSFCNTSICSISRACLLTGQYESRHGIDDFAKPLSPEAFAKTFPMLLKRAGYHTGFLGKWGVGDRDLPEAEYDDWRGFPGQGRYFEKDGQLHLTDRIAEQAVDFLRQSPKDRPFLLQVHFKSPHVQDGDTTRPFPPAARFESLYDDLAIPVPTNATEESFRRLPKFLQVSEARNRWEHRFSNPELYQRTVKDYYRLITGMDEAIGRIVEELRATGQFDRTVIFFTSDNGFYLGEHGLAGKWFPHEESIRVPLFIRAPRYPLNDAGRDVDSFVLTVDLAPTILELAGVPSPPMDGRSLCRFLRREPAGDWRTDFYYEHHFRHPGIAPSEAVRNERYKYIRWIEREPLVEQLFDVSKDPREENDLAGNEEVAEVLRAMRERWAALRGSIQ